MSDGISNDIASELASLINNDTISASEKIPEAEALKSTIDNSETIERIEKSRKLLIESNDKQESINIGPSGEKTKSSTSSSSTSKSSSTSTSSSGYDRGYGSSYFTSSTKSEEEKLHEKAEKYAQKKFERAKERAENSPKIKKWDLVSKANSKSVNMRKTPEELEKEQKKAERKAGFYRYLVIIGKVALEQIYVSLKKQEGK